MVPNTKNFVFHCKKTYWHLCALNWTVSCPWDPSILFTSVGTPSTRRAWKLKWYFGSHYRMDCWLVVVCNNMMQFDALKLSRMEIVTSGVEAHQACAIVIMSPHGFSGSPYLPGKKSSSFKCVKNAYCGTICALIVDLISYQGLSAPQRRRRRRGRN